MKPSCTSLLLRQFCCITWITYHHCHCRERFSLMNLNKSLLAPSKTEILLIGTKQQVFSSYKPISQQLYHPSPFVSSQSLFHLWLWRVILWSNQLTIQILSISYLRHPLCSTFDSSFSIQLLQIDLSQASLTIVIHYILAFHKLFSKNFNTWIVNPNTS